MQRVRTALKHLPVYSKQNAESPLWHMSMREAKKLKGSGEANIFCRHCNRASEVGLRSTCRFNSGGSHSIVVQLTDLWRLRHFSSAAITWRECETLALGQIFGGESGRVRALASKLHAWLSEGEPRRRAVHAEPIAEIFIPVHDNGWCESPMYADYASGRAWSGA